MTDRYYIAEYRTYDGFDESLKNCYQWNFNYAQLGRLVQLQPGLHLIYRDTFYTDNDVATHLGARRLDGRRRAADRRTASPTATARTTYVGYWRPRIQVRDAPFSLKPTKTQSIYFVDYDAGLGVGESTAPGKLAQPWFNDTRTYWYADAPEAGVKIPKKLGVRIQRQVHDARRS